MLLTPTLPPQWVRENTHKDKAKKWKKWRVIAGKSFQNTILPSPLSKRHVCQYAKLDTLDKKSPFQTLLKRAREKIVHQ
jgi:hypothetical protein